MTRLDYSELNYGGLDPNEAKLFALCNGDGFVISATVKEKDTNPRIKNKSILIWIGIANNKIIHQCSVETGKENLPMIALGANTNNLVAFYHELGHFQTWRLVTSNGFLGKKTYDLQCGKSYQFSHSVEQFCRVFANPSENLKFIPYTPYFITYTKTWARVWQLENNKIVEVASYNKGNTSCGSHYRLSVANDGSLITESGKLVIFPVIENFLINHLKEIEGVKTLPDCVKRIVLGYIPSDDKNDVTQDKGDSKPAP